MNKNELWSNPDDFPDVMNPAQNGFSVDVLIQNKKGEHTIGWFDFNTTTWLFLCREFQGIFKWRYLDQTIDTWKS